MAIGVETQLALGRNIPFCAEGLFSGCCTKYVVLFCIVFSIVLKIVGLL